MVSKRNKPPNITTTAQQLAANIAIVEEPSGPPTLAPIVAEVYGPDYSTRMELAQQVISELKSNDEIVDIDSSLQHKQTRWQINIDQQSYELSFLNVLLLVQYLYQ